MSNTALAPGVPVPTRKVPDNGDYLTDGRRLAMVVKVHTSGAVEIEDAVTEDHRLLTFAEYEANWRKVRRPHGLA